MIKGYKNISYLDYSKKIQSNFGMEGISDFCKQFGTDEDTARYIIQKYETTIMNILKIPSYIILQI